MRAMNQYWAKYPPLHIMVAAYFGFKAQPETHSQSSPENNTDQDLDDFMQLFSAVGGAVG